MPLTVIIEATSKRPGRRRYAGSLPGSEHVCAFETAASYWFLAALFATVQEQKAKDLARHGWCTFGGAELPALADAIRAAQTALEGQPQAWKVGTGDFSTPGEETYVLVQKQEIQAVLHHIVQAIHTAEARTTYLSFVNN